MAKQTKCSTKLKRYHGKTDKMFNETLKISWQNRQNVQRNFKDIMAKQTQCSTKL